MYDTLKEVKMMENNNCKKYMKIFGKDRFSVKFGNSLLLFSTILFILNLIICVCGDVEMLYIYIFGPIFLFIIGLLLGNFFKPKPDDTNIFIRKDNHLYFINSNNITIPDELKSARRAMTYNAPKEISGVYSLIGLIEQRKKIKELYKYLSQYDFNEPRYLDRIGCIIKTQIISETKTHIKVWLVFEKLKPKKVTIYNNYNDYQELVSLLKSMSH